MRLPDGKAGNRGDDHRAEGQAGPVRALPRLGRVGPERLQRGNAAHGQERQQGEQEADHQARPHAPGERGQPKA